MSRGEQDVRRLRTAFLRLRAAVRDPNTGLFGVAYHFDRIRSLLADRPRVGVLWISLGDCRIVETVYGWETYDRLIARVAEALVDGAGGTLPDGAIVTVAGVHADALGVFVGGTADGGEIDGPVLEALAARLEEQLGQEIEREIELGILDGLRVRVGVALLTDHPFHRFERRVLEALDRARTAAERPLDADRLGWLAELHRVVRERDVRCLFQPIVELASGSPVGLEAFVRGPERSVFRWPRVMFAVGHDAGLAGDLDRVCRARVIDAVGGGDPPPLLFVNTLAECLLDPEWRSAATATALAQAGLSARQLVLEIPESQFGPDPRRFVEPLAELRALGYRLSLDDIGSGPRTSELVEALRPDFIKLDMTLIRGLEADALRQEVVRSLVQLARRADARLIAERVETDSEREALLACGARLGQGYLFGVERAQRTPEARGTKRPGDAG
ncbi:MAG: hypothetical protein Kow0062_27740 [Acidobacteriota bacterium]